MRFIKLFQWNIKSVYKCVVKLTLALASVPLSPVLTSVCSHVPLLSSSFDLWHQCSQLLFPRDAAKLAVRQGSFPVSQIWAETLDWLLILQHPCASLTIFPQDRPVVRSLTSQVRTPRSPALDWCLHLTCGRDEGVAEELDYCRFMSGRGERLAVWMPSINHVDAINQRQPHALGAR